jgi:hypothetical protein
MAGGYGVPKSGVEAQVEWMRTIERRLDALTSAAGIKSAVISDPSDGSRMFLGNGNILMWDDYATNPDGFGRIYTDPVEGAHYFRMFPPHSAGSGLQNSLTMRGSAPGLSGAFWVYTDGTASLASGTATAVTAGTSISIDAATNIIVGAGGVVSSKAGGINRIESDTAIDMISGGRLGVYELPTTGAAPNLTLGFVGSDWTLATSVSSDRYKSDPAPLDVDIEDMLEYEPISWVHNDAMDASEPGDIRRNVGHHAEAMDALPSLRQFVNYNKGGEPDSVESTGFTGALHQAWKHTHGRVVELEQTVTEQAAEIAELKAANTAILARLDALETN